MNRFLQLTAAFALSASSASALSFGGGQITLGYDFNFANPARDTPHIEASFVFDLSDRFALQLDANYATYSAGAYPRFSIGAHASYQISPSLTAGVFYASTDWTGNPEDYYGLELRYDMNALSIEGYVSFASWDDTIIGVDGRYAMNDKLSILAGGAGYTDTLYIYTGGAYQMSNALALEATVGNLSYGSNNDLVVTLDLVYSFGGAAVWGPRSFTPIFPAY